MWTLQSIRKETEMQLKRKLTKAAAAVLSAAFVGLFGTAGYYSTKLPDSFTTGIGSELHIAGYPEISCCKTAAVSSVGVFPSTDQVTLSLFGAIPVKNIELHHAEAPTLLAAGQPFGIKLLMEGVMVTGLGDVETEDGKTVCPAAEAGIRAGDVIRLADSEELTSNAQLQEMISSSKGRSIELTVERGGSEFTASVTPVYSSRTNEWKGGMWVRDSIAGIGTMTFINAETGGFAGLGHPICDADTGGIVPLHSGEAVPVEITEAKKGVRGIPGELRGQFSSGSYGTLDRNNNSGIYGVLSDESLSELAEHCEEFQMGYRQEITTGAAEIYTTVSGSEPARYSAEIETIDYSSSDTPKNMIIKITDPELIDATGGIVQGMSGSPIIQNGKLIGAVTHVFVADPTHGYAIFAENMAQYLG